MIDGNRRWARAAGFDDVSQGHVVGAQHIANLLDWCTEVGVEHVTVWLLSTDNLRRPADELEPLLRIIAGVAEELSADGQAVARAGGRAPWTCCPARRQRRSRRPRSARPTGAG